MLSLRWKSNLNDFRLNFLRRLTDLMTSHKRRYQIFILQGWYWATQQMQNFILLFLFASFCRSADIAWTSFPDRTTGQKQYIQIPLKFLHRRLADLVTSHERHSCLSRRMNEQSNYCGRLSKSMNKKCRLLFQTESFVLRNSTQMRTHSQIRHVYRNERDCYRVSEWYIFV